MAVQVILAFIREKLNGAGKTLAGAQSRSHGRKREPSGKEIGLPADLLRRMGVGVGDQGEAVQRAQPPIHGRIRR